MLHDDATLVSVLVNLNRAYRTRADREAREQVVDEEYRLLGRIQEPRLTLQLHTHLGTSHLFYRGELRQAQEHYDRVLALYNHQEHRKLVLCFGLDPAVVAEVFSGASLWLTGWPDQARSRIKQGVSWAKELDSAFALFQALLITAHVHLWCGDLDEVGRLAAEMVSLAQEHGVAWYMVHGDNLQACIQVQRRKLEFELSSLIEGGSQYRVIGAPDLQSLYLGFLADAYGQVGRVDEGLETITDALRATEMYTSVFWDAELYRLKGELLLRSRVQSQGLWVKKGSKSKVQGAKAKIPIPQSAVRLPPPSGGNPQSVEAEACFQQAIEIAQQQEAKSLELRATMSLARLWQQQGKDAKGHKLLSKIHGWFSEGFDTKDLREAKVLLDEL